MVEKSTCIWYTCGLAYFTAYICGAALCWVFSKRLFVQSNPAFYGAIIVSVDIALSTAKRLLTLICSSRPASKKFVPVVNVCTRGTSGFFNLSGAALIAASMAIDLDLQEHGIAVLIVGILAVIFAFLAAVLKFIFTVVDFFVKRSNEKNNEQEKGDKNSTINKASTTIDIGIKLFKMLLKIVEQIINIA